MEWNGLSDGARSDIGALSLLEYGIRKGDESEHGGRTTADGVVCLKRNQCSP